VETASSAPLPQQLRGGTQLRWKPGCSRVPEGSPLPVSRRSGMRNTSAFPGPFRRVRPSLKAPRIRPRRGGPGLSNRAATHAAAAPQSMPVQNVPRDVRRFAMQVLRAASEKPGSTESIRLPQRYLVVVRAAHVIPAAAADQLAPAALQPRCTVWTPETGVLLGAIALRAGRLHISCDGR
jgi:hypothetical protein